MSRTASDKTTTSRAVPDPETGARSRYDLIDALRGITIVSMVLFHYCYDVFIVFGRDPGWYFRTGPHIWQQSICWSFILISGFVWSWGQKHNLRRGILINLCGLLVTAVTLLFMPSETIWFGVLNFIGCAILLMIPLHYVTEKIPAYTGIVISFVLFLFFRDVSYGVVGFGPLWQIRLPEALYTTKLLTPLGFPYPEFRSSDFFPVLPWFFLYLCGWFGNRIFQQHPSWQKAARTHVPFFTALGRRSLLIYLLHQPVCYLIAFLLFGI